MIQSNIPVCEQSNSRHVSLLAYLHNRGWSLFPVAHANAQRLFVAIYFYIELF